MFEGLCAFPFVPFAGETADLDAAARLVDHAVSAGVDSLGVLGSTGNYAYLDRRERREVLQLSVQAAAGIPVVAGIGALRTRDVLLLAEDAQSAGASALLLAPVSYQPLTEDEVLELFAQVCAASSVPIIVYDNPGTTKFTFSDELHGRIARLPQVAGVKLPPPAPGRAADRIGTLRAKLPAGYHLGISGDPMACEALAAGCTTWYSVIAGVLPAGMLELTRAALSGHREQAQRISDQMEPIWELFRAHGSLRVASALLEELGMVTSPSLPRPLLGLGEPVREKLRQAMDLAGL